jgi:hypothetical protein
MLVKVCSHQPSFLPWIGYWNKVCSSDVFIVMAGGDPRFAGSLPIMYSCCLTYDKYGRLEPEDPWVPEFISLEGLTYKA